MAENQNTIPDPTEQEEWRDIPEWNGYQVSNFGNVRTIGRHDRGHWIPMNPFINHGGYRMVALKRKQIGRKNKIIGVLVLSAFIGERPENMECCHWDGDKQNDYLSNLRWGTKRENTQDRDRQNRTPKGITHGNSRFSEQQIIEIRKRYLNRESTWKLAKEFHVSQPSIWRIVIRKSWKHIP